MRQRKSMEYIKDVRNLMVNVIPNVYYQNAPEQKTFPYLVFEVRAIAPMRLQIECDLWGRKGDETDLSDLADALEATLDEMVISNPFHTSEIFTDDNRQWMRDEDENIIRINLSFTATYQS